MNYPAERPAPAAAPARIGQGTAVEQSRAVAEVQAAIVVAQNCPRDINAAIAEMRQSCQQMFLAERAFFRYSRGSGSITGASVHLARELARCWGNIQYGLVEMRRDDEFGQSDRILATDPNSIIGDVRRNRQEIEASAFPGIPLYITEWSTSYSPRD